MFTADDIYFFNRDKNGVKVDFIIETGSGFELVEAKASERVDERKLNVKVAKLFSNTTSYLACMIDENSKVALKDYTMLNPLNCNLIL